MPANDTWHFNGSDLCKKSVFFKLSVVLLLPKRFPVVIRSEYSAMPLTLRRLMSYIYGAPILDVSRSHTMTQHSR